MSVNPDIKFDHRACTAVSDARVVDRCRIEDNLALPIDSYTEHCTGVNLILASQKRREVLLHFLKRKVCDKAQTPGIDCNDRELKFGHSTGDAKRGAVAAQHDDDISFFAKLFKAYPGAAGQMFGSACLQKVINILGLQNG